MSEPEVLVDSVSAMGADVIVVGAGLAGLVSAGTSRAADPGEVRIRVAGRTTTRSEAARIGREVSALWLNGPAGGAGATRNTREVIAIASVLLPRT